MAFKMNTLIGAAGFLLAGLLAGTADAQTLLDSVTKAARTHPRVDVVANNRQSIDQELRRARGLYLPQVDLRGAIGPEWADNSNTRTRVGNVGSEMLRRDSSLIVQQRLFDGWETDSEVERQQGRSKSASRRVRETSEFVGLDAIEAHIDVTRQRRILQYAEENRQIHQNMLARVRQRVAGGAGTAADVSQAQSRLDQASASVAETQGALDEAIARYRNIVGEAPGQLARADFPRGLPGTVEEVVALANRQNPTLNISEADIEAADAEAKGTRNVYYPKLNIEGGVNRNEDVGGVPGRNNAASVQLVVRWNLYRGGADLAAERAALGRLSQAKSQRMVAMRNAEEEARRSWAQLQAATQRGAVLESAVTQSTQVRDAYARQFELGQRTLLDLLDSENELFVNKSRLETVQQARTFAAFRVLATGGTLLSSLQVPLRDEADPAKAVGTPTRTAAAVLDNEIDRAKATAGKAPAAKAVDAKTAAPAIGAKRVDLAPTSVPAAKPVAVAPVAATPAAVAPVAATPAAVAPAAGPAPAPSTSDATPALPQRRASQQQPVKTQ